MSDEHPYEDRHGVLSRGGKVLFVCTLKKMWHVFIILARRQSQREMSMVKVILNNWGETKGKKHYHNMCILLNKTNYM